MGSYNNIADEFLLLLPPLGSSSVSYFGDYRVILSLSEYPRICRHGGSLDGVLRARTECRPTTSRIDETGKDITPRDSADCNGIA